MKKNSFIFLCTLFLFSCSCLKENFEDTNRLILTETNLLLLNGKYERISIQSNKDTSCGDLYWNFFNEGYNRKENSDFFEIKVVDIKKIRITYIDGNDTIKSKNMKGKLKDGYFEFNRKHLFIPMVFVNVYRNSKFRIGLSNDNNLVTDYKQITFGTAIFVYPIYEKKEENNIIFKRKITL